MAENNEIPGDAEKILFAEDFITYMVGFYNITYESSRADSYRDFVYKAFNESVQFAVSFIDKTMEMHMDDIFYFMENANLVDHVTYITYAKGLAERYFKEGFDATNFLHYCIRLAKLAVYFYNHDVLYAPSLAAQNICEVLGEYDMTTGGWDTLHRVAEFYASMDQDSTKMDSPESLDSDEGENPATENPATENPATENPATENEVGNLCNVNNENNGSNDNVSEVKQSNLTANEKVSNLPKRPLSLKEETNVPKKINKCNPGNINISNLPEMVPSTSGMSKTKQLNDASLSDDSEPKIIIDSRTSKIQSSSFNSQMNLELSGQSSLEDLSSADKEETSQASNVKFERYSPNSGDDEIVLSNQDPDPPH